MRSGGVASVAWATPASVAAAMPLELPLAVRSELAVTTDGWVNLTDEEG